MGIWQCHGLVPLEEQGLPCNLKYLKLENCANQEKQRTLQFGLQPCTTFYQRLCANQDRLTSLSSLCMSSLCPGLASLSDDGRLFPMTLSKLLISKMDSMPSLGFKNLPSLESLSIYRCHKVQSQGFPETLPRLEIRDC